VKCTFYEAKETRKEDTDYEIKQERGERDIIREMEEKRKEKKRETHLTSYIPCLP
jgi:hypothetical protein